MKRQKHVGMIRHGAAVLAAAGLLSGCFGCGPSLPGEDAGTDGSVVSEEEMKEVDPIDILIVGDSNTEYGHITGPLERLLEKEEGGYANGYRPLSEDFQSTGRNSVVVRNDQDWQRYDMTEQTIAESGSPCGIWVTSEKPGAATSVKFKGVGADFYYLAQPGGGSFTIEVSGGESVTVDTAASETATAKASIQGLQDGVHTVKLVVQNGPVTLQGFVPLFAQPAVGVVHNWGNAGANTRHYTAIDERLFTSAVEALSPDCVVVLLGTNDWFPAEEEAENLTTIVSRIQKAVPETPVLLTSTFDIDYADARKWMAIYLEEAYPVAARNTGCYYWNMHDWFGEYDPDRMLDGWHCNDKGGEMIAQEMWNQLRQVLNEPG